ncbi:hypothetical protein KKA14_14525, partial [bacterium]|nr:hypothetical protein [bacterium]
HEGRFEEEDLITLLREDDSVFQAYAIRALGRQKVITSIPELKSLFLKSDNPIILIRLLEAFFEFGTVDFVDVVIQRIDNSNKKRNRKPSENSVFDEGFIIDQIIIPSLKYLQIAGNEKDEWVIRQYIDNEDSNVRWHVLVAFNKLGISLREKEIQKIATTDKSRLVREQASIMLSKMKKG